MAPAQARSPRSSGAETAVTRDSLSATIRKFQLVHAVTTVAERAATHDLVEMHSLADVLVVLIPLIETGLAALNDLEARP